MKCVKEVGRASGHIFLGIFVWFLGAGGILLSLLAGCQGEPKPPSKPDAKASAPQTPTTEPKPKPTPGQPGPAEPAKPASGEEKTTPSPPEQPAPPALQPKTTSEEVEKVAPTQEEQSAFDPKEIERRRKMIEEEMARQEAEWREKQKRRIAELGPPLVENVDKLIRLHPVFPVWVDRDNKRIVMVGEICKREGPLEMFACLRRTKEHESIVVVDTTAQIVHAGLLAVGAQVGRPVQYDPYRPAAGDEIEVTAVWKDKEGREHSTRAQDWVRHMSSKKPMAHPWVFAGSYFAKSEETGQLSYMADGGDFICVSNFPTAMLDLPVASSNLNAELEFEAFTERIPPEGTPVTLILTPKKKADSLPPSERPSEPASKSTDVPTTPPSSDTQPPTIPPAQAPIRP